MLDRRTFVGAGLALAAGPALAHVDHWRMSDLYWNDLSFSDLARALDGERVAVRGFMAPRLRAQSTFFVLGTRPMGVCPFCETSAEWPDDILAVYPKRALRVEPFHVPLVTRGRLQLGEYRDPEPGFLSRVRIVGAAYERA